MGDTAPLRAGDAPGMPEPSAALWAEFCRLTNLGLRHPKEFDAEVKTTLRVIEAHRRNASVMRARSAEYDDVVAMEREKFAAWFDTIVAVIRMQQTAL